MKFFSIKKTFSFLFIFSLVFYFSSCQKLKKHEVSPEGKIILEASENTHSQKAETTRIWNPENEKIFVIYGYAFNSPEFTEKADKVLSERFGLEENEGLIVSLVFPDDFKNRISNLYEMANERNTRGIIILGAPENTHRVLARLQDFWNEEIPYPVFSFFPQDEILATEGVCDFILENMHKSAEESAAEGEDLTFDEKYVTELLIRSVEYMMALKSPLPLSSELSLHVQSICGSGKKIKRYIDGETGLQSINHYILQD